ncbi:myosin-10-like [Uloborus diversus]|uniref:myosin-10-like n=1 Tax=Uloborus diversus TaxID=327109 RepID=UPI002409D670|nr:myosin-10-like [Uloborus diversus]
MSSTASTENVAANMKIFHSTLEFRKSEILSLKFDLEKLPFEIEILPVVSNCIVIMNSCLNRRQYETALISKELESAENEVAQYGQDYSTRLSKIVKENEIVIQWLSPLINKLKEIEEDLKSEAMKILEACQKCYFDVLETFKIEKEAISIDIEMLQKVETYEKGIIDTEGKEIVVTLKDIFLAAFSLKKEELERFIRKKDIEDTVKMKASEILKEVQAEPRKRESISERKSLQRLRSTASIKSKESLTTASVKEEMQFGNFISYFNKIKADRKAKMEYLIMKDFEEIEGSLVKTASLEDFLDTHSIASEEFEEEPAKEPEKFVNKVYEVKVKQIEEEIANKRQKIKAVIKSRKSYMEDIICRKRKEMEGRIVSEEMKMNVTVNSIKEQGLHVVCTLKDLFLEILNKREQEKEEFTPKEESTLIETHEEKRITVMLEKFMDVILVIKEEDIAMMKQSKKKDVEKSVSNMKMELDDIIKVSEEKLEDVLSEYARKEKSKAMEFAVSGTVSVKDDSAICDEEIFPDVNRFQMFVKSLKCSLERPEKKKIAVYTDTSFRTEEIIKNNPARIPLLGSLPSKSEVPNKLLELFDVEVSHLKKVLKDIELNKAEAIQHGISFKTTETDESSAAFQHAQK